MRQSKRRVILFAALTVAFLSFGPHAEEPKSGGKNETLFAVQVTVGPSWDSSKAPGEQAFFREHSANLKKLREAGVIVMGARYSDVGLLVFAASSAEAVHEMMQQDPSIDAGTFRYTVHPMNVFYPWREGTSP